MSDGTSALTAYLRDALKTAERDYKTANPMAQGLKIAGQLVAYKPRPKAFADHAYQLVALMLSDRRNLGRSNAELAVMLNAKDSNFKVPLNIMSENIRPIDKAKIATLMAERGLPISLVLFNTPSKIKGALKAHLSSALAPWRCYREVFISTDAVVIGDKYYPIQVQGRQRRIHVGSRKLNVDGLKDFLGS